MVPTLDVPFPYQRDFVGEWYLPDPSIVAHEIGHVLGLGDDYFSQKLGKATGYKPSGDELEGGADFRMGGTFTTSGIGAPDPSAIARVVEQIKAAGLLPQCWKGSFDWSIRQPVYSGPQNWDGHAELKLVSDSHGKLTGTITGTQTQTLALARCHSVTRGNMSAKVIGSLNQDQTRMALDIADKQASWPQRTSCAEGLGAGTGSIVFEWPHLKEALSGLMRSGEDQYRFDGEWMIARQYPATIRYALQVWRPDQAKARL
jgi:hypothetical protein